MNIRPIGSNIIVVRDKAPEKSKGGIVLPEISKEAPCKGVVYAVGPGYLQEGERIPLDVGMGDTVYFLPHACHKLEINNEEYHVLSEASVLAVVPASK